MRLYIAAPWVDKEKMPAIADRIVKAGHEITHAWWEVEEAPNDPTRAAYLREHAIADLNGVRNADLVVVLNTVKSEGKATEQGIAIAYNKAIIGVGDKTVAVNVFHYLPNYIWVEDLDELMKVLDTLTWATTYRM